MRRVRTDTSRAKPAAERPKNSQFPRWVGTWVPGPWASHPGSLLRFRKELPRRVRTCTVCYQGAGSWDEIGDQQSVNPETETWFPGKPTWRWEQINAMLPGGAHKWGWRPVLGLPWPPPWQEGSWAAGSNFWLVWHLHLLVVRVSPSISRFPSTGLAPLEGVPS